MNGEVDVLVIEDIFHETVNKYRMLDKGDGVVVALSGGPDSMALFHLLYRFKDCYGINLITVHLNHNFRPGEAEKEAEYVRRVSEARRIPCIIESCDVPTMARRGNLSWEQAGRKARYEFFNRVMADMNYNRIAVAHNHNDQAETVVMRFIRGSGMEGLGGIHPVRGNIIRPLIEVPRRLIEEYCRAHNLNPVIDRSNMEPVYTRNKIRLELLPYLRKEYNENIDGVVCDTAYLLRDENDFLSRIASQNFREALLSGGKNRLVMDLNKLNGFHDALLRRVLRLAVEKLKGDKTDIAFKHIQDIICLVKAGKTGACIHLPHGIRAETGYGKFFITSGEDVTQSIDRIYELRVPGETFIDELGSVVEATILTQEDYCKEKGSRDRFTAYLDFDKTGEYLYLRGRKAGDRFKPLGMKGTRKIKDFFIDLKIPRRERDAVPLIQNSRDIVWVTGLRINEDYKIDGSTVNILRLGYRQ